MTEFDKIDRVNRDGSVVDRLDRVDRHMPVACLLTELTRLTGFDRVDRD